MVGPEYISGALVHSHIAALRARLSVPRYEARFHELSTEDQEHLRLVTALSWVRIDAFERLYSVLAEETRLTVAELHTEIAAEVVGRTITTIWRAILRFANDETLMARAPSVYKRAYQQGTLTVQRSGPGFAEVKLADWPDPSEFALRGLRVGIESTLRATGRKTPRGVAMRLRDGAVIRFEWDV